MPEYSPTPLGPRRAQPRRLTVGSRIATIVATVVTTVGVLFAALTYFDRNPLQPLDEKRLANELRPACADTSEALRARWSKKHRIKRADIDLFVEDFCRRRQLVRESQRRGTTAAMSRQFETAQREFESAARLDSGDAKNWLNLAALHSLTGDHDKARRAYEEGLVLTEDDWQLEQNFGLFLARTGQANEARRYLEEALAELRASPDLTRPLEELLKQLATDPELAEFRRTPAYRKLETPL